jgi:hypothetical protein
MVAAHGRLDEAGAVALAAALQRELETARALG